MSRHSNFLLAVLAFSVWTFPASGEEALRVGVAYTPPEDGAPLARLYTEDGFEVALARDLSRLTGRPLRLVQVPDELRVQALANGDVDAVITRLTGDDPLRSETDVAASGYSSGLSASMRSDTSIRTWSDFEGKTVCVSDANRAAQRHLYTVGASVKVERAPARTLALVRTGACDAAIHDSALLQVLFEDVNWTKFSATVPQILPSELVLLLPKQSSPALTQLRTAFSSLADPKVWQERKAQWAKNVALEVYLDQDGPDCH